MSDLTERELDDLPYDDDMIEADNREEADPDDLRDAQIFDAMVTDSEREAEFWKTHDRTPARGE